MVSFVLVISGFALVLIGAVYAFTSDGVDAATATPILPTYTSPETTATFNLLMFCFKFILIPCLLGILFFLFSMAQKPERPW